MKRRWAGLSGRGIEAERKKKGEEDSNIRTKGGEKDMKMKGTFLVYLRVWELVFLSVCLFVSVRTVVLVLDGEAEDVAGPEARAVVHAAVEERVGVGILDVKDLTRGGHMACNALVCRDPELLLQPRRRNSMGASVGHHGKSRGTSESETRVGRHQGGSRRPFRSLTSSSLTTPPSKTLATSSWLRRSNRKTEQLQECAGESARGGGAKLEGFMTQHKTVA